ncbi:MAG: hypothetical protein QOF26_847 [Baekduia sp.]|jgi:hypothetical protein|nr:hypothetical protein [Baekduia sp.]MDX6700621.1 hypothetical protein [Baekduia sp.]
MPSKTCCRSCPRCDDCPVLVAARARARARRNERTVTSLVDEVFCGLQHRTLPESVTATLEALDVARRAPLTARRERVLTPVA